MKILTNLIIIFTLTGLVDTIVYSDESKPVVTPKKPTENQEFKPTSGQALLPIELIKNKISNLKIGGTCYIAPNAIRVDHNRKVWLNPNELTGQRNSQRIIFIRRDSNGYHVVIETTDHQWEASEFDSSDLIPVKSINSKSESKDD